MKSVICVNFINPTSRTISISAQGTNTQNNQGINPVAQWHTATAGISREVCIV